MWKYIKSIFARKFWIEPFPEQYSPECFDCNKLSCTGCKYFEYKGE